MTPVARSTRGKPVVSYPFKSDKVSLARARSLWGEEAFAEIQDGKLGLCCRVGIMSGSTKIVFGASGTWDEAFHQAIEGQESYASTLKLRLR
jgi:hypothetical protein